MHLLLAGQDARLWHVPQQGGRGGGLGGAGGPAAKWSLRSTHSGNAFCGQPSPCSVASSPCSVACSKAGDLASRCLRAPTPWSAGAVHVRHSGAGGGEGHLHRPGHWAAAPPTRPNDGAPTHSPGQWIGPPGPCSLLPLGRHLPASSGHFTGSCKDAAVLVCPLASWAILMLVLASS